MQQQFHFRRFKLVLQQRDGKTVFTAFVLTQHIGQLQACQRLAQRLRVARDAVALQQLGQGDQAGLPGLGGVVDHDAVEAAGGFVVAQAAPARQRILHGLRGQGLREVAGFDHALAGGQCLQALLAQDGDQVGALAAGVHQAVHQALVVKTQAQFAQRLGGQLAAGAALQAANGQHFAKVAQGALVVEHGRGIQIPEAREHEPAAALFAERAQGGQLHVAVGRFVTEEQVGLVDEQHQALALVLRLQVVHDGFERGVGRQAKLQRHARRQAVVAQRDVVAHGVRVARHAALHGLEQAAFAELAPTHHQVVGGLAVDDTGQQLGAAKKATLARHTAACLVGRDARDAQLRGQLAQQHLQGIAANQPFGLVGAVQHHMQVGAVVGMGAQQGPGRVHAVLAQDQQHVAAGLHRAQLAQHGGFVDAGRGHKHQAAVQRHGQVGRELPLKHGTGQRPVGAGLAAGRHALGQRARQGRGALAARGLGAGHGAAPVHRADVGGQQGGVQPPQPAQQAVNLRQARQRRAAQACGAQLARTDERVAHHPQHGAHPKDHGAPRDQRAHPAKRVGIGHLRGALEIVGAALQAVDGQVAQGDGWLAGAAGPGGGARFQLHHHLGASELAQLGVLGDVGLQHIGARGGNAQLRLGHRGRVGINVLGPVAQLVVRLHHRHAPLHQLAPHRPHVHGRHEPAARGRVVLGREHRTGHKQRDQRDDHSAHHGFGQQGLQSAEHESSTMKPASRMVAQRQCSRAASPAPRTWMRLPQNRLRSSSSCR